MNTLVIKTLIYTASIGVWLVQSVSADSRSFESRRQNLLDVLLSSKMEAHLNNFEVKHNERYRWAYFNACLASGIHLEEANDYFANHKDIGSSLPEWQQMELTRTYLRFKDEGLDEPAKRNIETLLEKYKRKLDDPGASHAGRWDTTGNHSIVNYVAFLLLDQEGFGNATEARKEYFKESFLDWVQNQGRNGHNEVNSPHYKERSMNPLLNLYDFSNHETLKLWAQIALDHMLADWALMSIDNSRGGPWCRAIQTINPTFDWVDNRQDGLHPAGYLFLGGSYVPDYHWGNCVQSWSFIVTSSYRAPQALINIANKTEPYVYRGHRTRGFSEEAERVQDPAYAEWNMYYYVDPSYSLGSVQDWAYVDNYYPRGNVGGQERDWKNTQVWELSFSHPTKILGAKRDLNSSLEKDCPNASLMQYENVLFYKGDFLDYNGNLASDGGTYSREYSRNKVFHFWEVKVNEGYVYVGAIDFPTSNAGIIEVRAASTYQGTFSDFREDIKNNQCSIDDEGSQVIYSSTSSDSIVYLNPSKQQNQGSALVNGKPFALHQYPLHDSVYSKSALGSGVIKYEKGGQRLHLDFGNRKNPFRKVGG